jgi:hypothetical protein
MDGNIEGKSLLIGQVSKLRDKEEQEKTIDVTENGTTEVIPDGGKTLSKVTVNVNVAGGAEEIENLIDNSGVLDGAEGSVTEKVEQLIDKVKSGSSPSIDENGIVTFGANTNIDENGIVSL